MRTVQIVSTPGTRAFAVTLDEDYFGPQNDHKRLDLAISGTSGAKLGEQWTEAHSDLSSRDQYLLEVTANNDMPGVTDLNSTMHGSGRISVFRRETAPENLPAQNARRG
jgi:hypothetical protein